MSVFPSIHFVKTLILKLGAFITVLTIFCTMYTSILNVKCWIYNFLLSFKNTFLPGKQDHIQIICFIYLQDIYPTKIAIFKDWNHYVILYTINVYKVIFKKIPEILDMLGKTVKWHAYLLRKVTHAWYILGFNLFVVVNQVACLTASNRSDKLQNAPMRHSTTSTQCL